MQESLASEGTAPAPATQALSDGPRNFDPFAAMRAIRTSTTLSSTERLVALVLVSHADRRGVCWPSVATLAKETALSKSSVHRALVALRKAGILDWKQRIAQGTSSVYALRLGADGGSPTVGEGSVTMGEAGLPQRQTGSVTVGDKLPMDQPIKTTHGAGGKEAPPHAPMGPKKGEVEDTEAKDWAFVVAEHQRLRTKVYGTTGPDELVPAENRRAVVKFLNETADQIAAEWTTIPGCTAPRDGTMAYLTRELLEAWFDEETCNEYLTRRAHPLRALRDDLAALVAGWWPTWEAKLAAAKATGRAREAS